MRERATPRARPPLDPARSLGAPEDVTDVGRFESAWARALGALPSPESTTAIAPAWPVPGLDRLFEPASLDLEPTRPLDGDALDAKPEPEPAADLPPADEEVTGELVFQEQGGVEIMVVLDELIHSGDVDAYAQSSGDLVESSPLSGLAAEPLPPALPTFPAFPASNRAPGPAAVAEAQKKLGLDTASSDALARALAEAADAVSADVAPPSGDLDPSLAPAFQALLSEAEDGLGTAAPRPVASARPALVVLDPPPKTPLPRLEAASAAPRSNMLDVEFEVARPKTGPSSKPGAQPLGRLRLASPLPGPGAPSMPLSALAELPALPPPPPALSALSAFGPAPRPLEGRTAAPERSLAATLAGVGGALAAAAIAVLARHVALPPALAGGGALALIALVGAVLAYVLLRDRTATTSRALLLAARTAVSEREPLLGFALTTGVVAGLLFVRFGMQAFPGDAARLAALSAAMGGAFFPLALGFVADLLLFRVFVGRALARGLVGDLAPIVLSVALYAVFAAASCGLGAPELFRALILTVSVGGPAAVLHQRTGRLAEPVICEATTILVALIGLG